MADKTYTLIDYFKAFHSMKETLRLSAGSQAVYFSILGEFNRARFPEQLNISTRELKALAGLKSTNAVFENRNVLKNKKLIDFQTEGGITTYTLSSAHLLNTCRTPVDRLEERTQNAETNSNIRAREDVKTLDFKTISSLNPRTSAFENWDCENELVTLWLDNGGARVTAELLSYLQALTEKNGVEWTASLIREAASAFSGEYAMSLNYLRGCAERKQKGGKKRGENQQHPSPQPSTHRSDDTIIEEDNPEWRELIALEEARRKESERKRAEYFAGVAKLQRFFFGTSSDSD